MGAFPVNTPVLNLTAQVQDPSNVKIPDGTAQTLTGDPQGAALVRELGGRYLAAAQRGNMFIASTLIAGVSLAVLDDTSMVATAGLVNPTGSGKNIELVAVAVSSVTIQVALKQTGMVFQLGYSQNGGAPTSVTRLTAYGTPLSQQLKTPVGYAFSAATMTNGTLAPLLWPFGNYETAVGFVPTWFYFNGEILMGPDTVMSIVNTTTALAAVNLTYVWSEWPA